MLTKIGKSKNSQRVLAIILIITMTFANLLFLGKNLISYAFETNLEMQGTDTQSNNVKFDAYLIDNGGNNTHSVIFDATNNNKINLYISVKNAGYLKEAYIDFRNENNQTDTNYEISSNDEDTTLIQNVNTNLKTISLNYIESGTEAILEIPISIELSELMDVSKLKQNSKVTLRGIYVNEKGKEIEISKTIKLNIGWTIDTELNLEQSITKYIPYETSEESGVILQLSVKANQNRDDVVLPVKSSQIKLNVPEIANTLPEKVIVIADKTLATNGDKLEFTDENWEYNEQEKTITINTQGYEENGKALAEIGEDKYFVTYIYPSNVYEAVSESEITLPSDIEAKMELYSAEGIIEKTAELKENITLNEKQGDIVTYNIEAIQKEISKGRMYANCNSNVKTYDTEYKTVLKANVSNYEMVENITMQLPTDDFISGEDSYPIYNTYYKELTINKAKMQKILGEDGFVNISDGTNTYIINKDTQDVDGNYVITLEEKTSNLTVQTSKPVEDEIFKIDATKVISKDLTYTKNQLKKVNGLKVNVMGINNQAEYDLINLTETKTYAELEMSNVDLVSLTENNAVNFKIMLNNSSEESDLYKNAVFEIALPKYVEDISGTANILYTSGLTIDKIEKINTENGIILKITTSGAESTFSDGVLTNGTVITIDANLTIGEVEEDITEKVVFTYTNENATVYENEGMQEIDVNFIARQNVGMFTTNPNTEVDPQEIDLESNDDPDAKATLEANTKVMSQDEEIASTDSIIERKEVKYITTIKNTSTVDAKDVKLVTNIENGKILHTILKIVDAKGNVVTTKDHTVDKDNVTTFTANWERIPAGGSGILEYTVLPKNVEEIENSAGVTTIDGQYMKFNEDDTMTAISYEEYIDYIKLRNTVEVTAQNLDEKIENKVNNIIDKTDIVVELLGDSQTTFLNDYKVQINLLVKNVSEEVINNVVITQVIPEGLEFIPLEGQEDIKYDENTRTITINVNKIEAKNHFIEVINVKTNLPETVGNMQIENKAKVSVEGKGTWDSNILTLNVVAPVLSVDLNSNIANGSYVKEGQNIEITGTAKNTGGTKSRNTALSIILPDGFRVTDATYMLDNGETQELTTIYGNEYYLSTSLDVDEKVTFKIVGTATIQNDLDEEEININATIKDEKRKPVSSNTLTYKVEKVVDTPDNPTNPDNPNPDDPTVKTYKISGIAWLDENKDGKKDENEKLLEGINVLLIDAKTGVIVTDKTNGTVKEVKTSSEGKYTFSNLPKGTYMVIFEYDSAYYDVTEYNKSEVTEDLSSKAIQTKINKDGVLKLAGVTNTITITDSSIANINIGLVERPKFDLSLQKQLSIVKVENSSGTTTYAFDNTKLGKIDIPGNYLKSTTVTMQYKIIVKNDGAVAGTAKKVVDYIPSDLKFDNSQNAGWYIGTDGNLYNETLANTILQPGESKELTLILTKKMTEDNTGLVTNKAEIYEDYNEYGYEDYNSKPANNAQNENDFDYVSLILTVKTGQTILYITITLISLAIIAIGVYFINKKVLKGGNN